jgi:Uma2 family endonuclease
MPSFRSSHRYEKNFVTQKNLNRTKQCGGLRKAAMARERFGSASLHWPFVSPNPPVLPPRSGGCAIIRGCRALKMSLSTQTITADDLNRMPEDGYRYELVRGEIRRMSPTGYRHGRIGARLTSRIARHVESNDLGVVVGAETGFRLTSNPDTVRAPDIAFIRHERVEAVGDTESFWPGAPDLAVEVLSPNDRIAELEEKVEMFLQAGTRAVWVLSPKLRTITVYKSLTDIVVLTENDELDCGEILPGFKVSVSEIFE